MRIAIVNDLRLAQAVLSMTIEAIPNGRIAWIANDGREALEHCRRDRPDLILMDMVMPVMDGAVATRAIMKECPCPILVVTSTIEGNLALVYEALGAGAIDAVHTPTLGPGNMLVGGDVLAKKVRVAIMSAESSGSATPQSRAPSPARASAAAVTPNRSDAAAPLVLIGASTGGPHALAEVLRGLSPAAPSCCSMIVQHIDLAYVDGLASWLTGEIGRKVRVACEGELPAKGETIVAATTDHMLLRDGKVRYRNLPGDDLHRPSVDHFFESAARDQGPPGVAILLTGMGRDGAEGLRALRDANWHTIAQDEATSIVWGMPGTAVALGGAIQVLRLDSIGAAAGRVILGSGCPGGRGR